MKIKGVLFFLTLLINTVFAKGLVVDIKSIDSSHFPVIVAYFTVQDEGGAYIRNLPENVFRVYEDGVRVPNPIVETAKQSMNIVMVLDTSGSMKYYFEDCQKAAYALLKIFNPYDNIEIVSFDEKVKVLQKFTTDRYKLTKAVLSVKPWGGTILYDALSFAIEEVASRRGKGAVLVITDGYDETRDNKPRLSKATLKEVVDRAKRFNVPVFVVGIGHVNEEVLETLAQATGGEYYHNPHPIELAQLYRAMGGNWEAVYKLTYATPFYFPDGSIRKVEVEAIYGKVSGIGKAFYEAPGKSGVKEVVEQRWWQYYPVEGGKVLLKNYGKWRAVRND